MIMKMIYDLHDTKQQRQTALTRMGQNSVLSGCFIIIRNRIICHWTSHMLNKKKSEDKNQLGSNRTGLGEKCLLPFMCDLVLEPTEILLFV